MHITIMKRLLYLLPLLLLTCNKKEPFVLEGEWKIDRLESVEDYYLPGLTFTTDTVFDDALIYFDTLGAYTILDGSVSPIEIIGYHWANRFFHTYQDVDSSVWIGVEEWKYVVKTNEELVIENMTEYGIVGEQLRTLYLYKN